MKRFPFIAAGLLLLSIAGCRTTEQNYRTAYEAAKAHQDSTGGIANTVFNQYRPQGPGATITYGENDSLNYHVVTIGFTKDEGATQKSVKRYNIVVGQFKQIFNARKMRERLMNNGYPDAFIVNNREPLYYVIASSVATPAEAADAITLLRSDNTITLRDPFPWVLVPSYFK